MSMDDPSKSAKTAKIFYAQTRDEVLRNHRWNFATKRETLTATTRPLYGYNYAYELPGDFLRAVEINQQDIFDSVRYFEIEGLTLVTDYDKAKLKYIFRETDAEKFDPLFVEALAIKLASKIAMNLTGNATMSQTLLQQYHAITAPLAKQVNSAEDRPAIVYQPTDSRLAQVRRQGALHSPFNDKV